jgi:hypothetical protein
MATSTLLPPSPPALSSAVEVVVNLTQAKKLAWHALGAPLSGAFLIIKSREPKNGVFTQDVAVTVNAVWAELGENCSVELTMFFGLVWSK